MTRSLKRPNAARLTFQIAAACSLAGVIIGGCSSDVKTVTVEDCPTGGTPSAGGHATSVAGMQSGGGGGNTGTVMEAAGEAGTTQSGGESSAGSSGNGASSGSAGTNGNGALAGSGGAVGSGGSAGRASGGAAGSGGSAGRASGGSGGKGSGGSGGKGGGGSTNAGGQSGAVGVGGTTSAVCGDTVVTSPEFCDNGKNKSTDLSYGCYACTTLPTAVAGNTPQCEACLQPVPKSETCYACKDYRACYACLRRQPSDFAPESKCALLDADTDPDPTKDSSYPYTPKGLSDRCFDPNNVDFKTATGGPLGPQASGLTCQALLACILRSGCGLGKQLLADCYCGDDPKKKCASDDAFVPNGPCVKEMIDADAPSATTTGAALALDIAQWLPDPSPASQEPANHAPALGAVSVLALCAADPLGCRAECFPEFTSAGGAGGSAGSGGKSGAAGNGGKGGS